MKKFLARSEAERKEEKLVLDELAVSLARLEDEAGNYGQAINWFHLAQKVSPAPDALQRQIDELQKKLDDGLPLVPQKLF